MTHNKPGYKVESSGVCLNPTRLGKTYFIAWIFFFKLKMYLAAYRHDIKTPNMISVQNLSYGIFFNIHPN